MLRIEVKTDSSALMSRISYLVPELRVQTAKALNWTIYNVRDAQRRAMAQVFDRPTPFTLNQTNRVMLATPDLLQAQTKIRDDQSSGVAPSNYLGPQIYGGRRKVKASEKALQANGLMPTGWIAIPGPGARLDAYGNMSRGQISLILNYLGTYREAGYNTIQAKDRDRFKRGSKKRRGFVLFVARVGNKNGLQPGVYERTAFGFGQAIKPLLIFVSRATYRARFDFVGIAKRTTEQRFPQEFAAAFKRAVATAR